jgi:hypothetical protein
MSIIVLIYHCREIYILLTERYFEKTSKNDCINTIERDCFDFEFIEALPNMSAA